ncbi:MAG TPA: PmoA family protein [Planctomycetota bacterium]|jgi:hypothetical protein
MRHVLFSLAFGCCALALSGEGPTVTVAAGELDRKDCIVNFALPEVVAAGNYALRDEAGGLLPLQVDGAHQGCFVLDQLKAGQSKTYSVVKQEPAANAGVSVTKNGTALDVTIDGKKVISYFVEKSELPKGYGPEFQRGGYIYPVLTPSGKLVTDDYPPAHKHHHSVWGAWTKTEFEGRHPDFWNMGAKTATVEPLGLWSAENAQKFFPDEVGRASLPAGGHGGPPYWSGPVQGGFEAFHKYVDLGNPKAADAHPTDALFEDWRVNVYRLGAADAKYRIFDIAIVQRCASKSPLVLPTYHYGGLGIRGHRTWDGKDNCEYLTSEGKTRATGNTKPEGKPERARWCNMSGKVDGELAGITLLDHPSNFRAPQPLRLHPTEPFIGTAPEQLGQFEITPEKGYVAKYRLVVADGAPNAADLDRLWKDYATPPVVTVK